LFIKVQSKSSSKTISFKNVSVCMTIKTLKERVSATSGTPVEEQRLLYCGKVCLDSSFVGDYLLGAAIRGKPSAKFYLTPMTNVTHKVIVTVFDFKSGHISGAPFPLQINVPISTMVDHVENRYGIQPCSVYMSFNGYLNKLTTSKMLLDYGVTAPVSTVRILMKFNDKSSPLSFTMSWLLPLAILVANTALARLYWGNNPAAVHLNELSSICTRRRINISKRPAGYMTRLTSKYRGFR
jgi:hypothetical protein